MKIGKVLILAMTICCLLIVSSIQIAALEKSETLEDGLEDVFSYETQEIVTENQYIEVDNIDITQVEYEITDETIEFTITVKGVIEDRGSLDEIDPEATSFNIDTVTYSFELVTSEDWYSIQYANNTCRVSDSSGTTTNLTESDFTASGGFLTVSFDWDTAGQTFEEVTVNAQYMRLVLNLEDFSGDDLDEFEDFAIIWLVDQVPNGPLEVYVDTTNLGEVGVAVEFDGIAIAGYPPYTYNWDFGDGESSSDSDPTHIYDKAGEYEYEFTVTDSEDISESYAGSIEIVGDDDNDTPGFEFIIAIMAIGLIFLWKKKR